MSSSDPAGRRAIVARILLVLVLVAVVLVLLWPSRPAASSQNELEAWLERLHARGLPRWLGFGAVEFLANVVMFLPLGFLTVLGWPRARWWMQSMGWLMFSAAAEITQASLESDRVGDWRDVLANTLGAALGAWAARSWVGGRIGTAALANDLRI